MNLLLQCSPLFQSLAAAIVVGCCTWIILECVQLWRQSDRTDRGRLILGLVFALGGLVAWQLLVPPSYLHSNVLGPSLVDTATCQGSTRVDEFGPFGFWVQGAFLRLTTGGLAGLAAVHAVFGVFALIALGLGMRQIVGGVTPLVATVACGLSWAPIMRITRSEDMHTLGALFAAVMFAGLMTFAREGRRWPAWTALLAGSLLPFTRQTYLPWILLVTALALIPWRRTFSRHWSALLGLVMMFGLMAARIVHTSRHPADAISVEMILDLMIDPGIWWSAASYHPWFNIAGGALVMLPLSILGMVRLVKTGVTGTLFVLGALAYFAVTLPSGVPNPGDNLAFRMPVFLLLVGCAGVCVAGIVRWIETRRPNVALRIESALVVGLSVALWIPAMRSNVLAVSPLVADEQFLREAAKDLDPTATIYLFRGKLRYAPTYSGPVRSTWKGPALEVSADGPRSSAAFRERHVYFYQGISCFTYSSAELYSWTHPDIRKGRTPLPEAGLIRDLRAVVVASYRHELPPGVRLAPGIRPECARLTRHGRRIGRSVVIPRPADELPFSVYSGDAELALYELDASILDEPPFPVPAAPGEMQSEVGER